MENIQLTARFKIHDGRLEEFKKVAEECLSVTKEKDKDTLQYDWFFSKDQTECIIRENWIDSNSLLTHLGNLGDLLGKLLEVSDLYPEVYGNPSEELINATAALNPKIYSFYQGL